jgi:asparagine synthase (glutamine-hydrolysing)
MESDRRSTGTRLLRSAENRYHPHHVQRSSGEFRVRYAIIIRKIGAANNDLQSSQSTLALAILMCGIAGIVGRIVEPNRTALERISGALTHRGPDGAGYWESSPDERGWGAMLAHRRLSILDLSSAGAQPMVDPVTGDVVVLNGEIYNYVALRDRLAATGHKFHSSGDTAVMLRALSVHGGQAVRGLRGMFAFAYWNVHERKLVLARDPLGIKPLYVARNPDPEGGWSLIFSSEVRAILVSGLLGKPQLDPSAAASIA